MIAPAQGCQEFDIIWGIICMQYAQKNRDNSLAIKQTVFQHGNSSVKTIAPR